jgi:hypothetical protein
MATIKRTADDIKKLIESIYVPRHEFRPVDARTFRHLDLHFYDEARDNFIAQGCTWFGDYEDLTLKSSGGDLQTFFRNLITEDRTICIGLYHPKPKFWIRLILWMHRVKLGKIMDCETEFSSGEYIVTSNAAEAGKLNTPPSFDMKYFPVDTSYETIFQTHRQRVMDFLTANPNISATTLQSPEEVLEMHNRINIAKAAYRKGIGNITVDELKRLGATSHTAMKIKQSMNRSENER